VTGGRDELYARTPGEPRRTVANVLMNELAAAEVDPADVKGEELGRLIGARQRIPRETFTKALAASADVDFDADAYLGDALIGDAAELDPVIERVMTAHEEQVAAYRAGKEGLLGFLVGQVMRETQGKANPRIVNERLRERLKA
jgi:Asp-tRNA(Asn)/Glu-tRNA(Gln) amidotransferase B subunit